MAQKKTATVTNRFKEYHNYLLKNDSIESKSTIETICAMLSISLTNYYRKLSNPDSLSPAEKMAVASIYKLPVHFIFPEMEETVNA